MIEKDLRNRKAKFEMFSNEALPYSVAHQSGGDLTYPTLIYANPKLQIYSLFM